MKNEKLYLNNELFLSGQVLGFPVDFNLVLKHLQQDMRDDWYSDTLGYADILSDSEYAMSVILKCLDEWGGVYSGQRRVVRAIPKKGFAERYSLETDIFDRFVYQSICSFLIPHLDPLLSHRVLSYRYSRFSSNKKYLFRNKISKWLDYDGLTYTFYQDNKFLAVTDVSNFFENVSTSQVVESLTELAAKCDCSGYEKGHIRSAINLLSLLLKNWSYSGDFGLPQNRDASSFISNVLLSRVDFEMQAQNYDYYRYVDDIRIICKTELIAQRALQHVTSLLRSVGMNINAGKTTILSKKSSVSEIYEHFPSRDPLVAAIDSMWRSRSRRVFMRSIEYIIDIIQESFDKGETQSRSFRFAVNRLSQLADAGLFDVSGVSAERLLDYAIQVLKSEARSTDQICRLITVLEPDNVYLGKLGDYLVDRENCLHDWQNHLLWMLLASRQFDREDLRDFAESLTANDPTSGEASGVFIWLQAIGHLSPIENLVDKYTSLWPFQNQRYYLMALSGCSATSRDRLRGKVPFYLIGTIDRSRKGFRDDGVAIRQREKPSLSDLYEDIKDYC